MRLGRSSILLVVAVTAPPVAAQNVRDSIPVDSTRAGGDFVLDGITVSVARPGLTTGGSSSVTIELDSISSIPAPTLDQVLRHMPLIQIRTNSRGEAQPALRGSKGRQIAVLVDGVPLTLGWDHRSDLSIIPLTAARSITLLRGLSSVLYGPNTLGGVVEVEVARTRRTILSVDPLVFGFALDETGGTNVSATGGSVLEGLYSQWVVRGGVGYQDRPGVPVPQGVTSDLDIRPQYLADDDLRLNSDSRRVDGFVSARYLGDGGAWASLAASGYDVERGVPPEAHQDGPRLWRYPGQRRVLAALSGGTGQRSTPRGVGDLEASLGVDLGATEIHQYQDESFQRVVEEEDADDRTLTLRLLGDHSLGEAADLRMALTYADVSHDEVLRPGGASDYRQRLWSLGAETEWQLGARHRTRFALGAAVDGADTPETGDKPSLGRLWDYGFRVGMSSLLSDRLLAHGGVSRRARFPSLRELYSGALGRFEPNPDLRAETLLGAEGGFTVQAAGGEFQVVGFYHRLANGIVRTSVTGPDGVSRFKRINQKEVRSAGLEVLAVGAVGGATVSADLTVQSARGISDTGAHVELEYEPSVYGKLGVDVPLLAGVRAASEFRFVGEQRCQNPEIGRLQPLASSRVLDLSLRRIFRLGGGGAMSNVDATASVNNVTDAVVYDQCGLPQPGQTLVVQLRVW